MLGLAATEAMTGGVVSETVKVVEHTVLLPAESLTATVIVCVPNPAIVPAAGF